MSSRCNYLYILNVIDLLELIRRNKQKHVLKPDKVLIVNTNLNHVSDPLISSKVVRLSNIPYSGPTYPLISSKVVRLSNIPYSGHTYHIDLSTNVTMIRYHDNSALTW